MPMGNNSPRSTVCILLALLCSFISPTPLEKRPPEYVTQAPQFEPRDVWVTKYEVATAVNVNPPFYDTQCQVGGCTFNYESVSLFYWASTFQNTACLATLASPPVLTPPAGLLIQSPSIYAIFTSFYLYDGCGTKLLEASMDLTTSFESDVLSTVATLPGGGLTTEIFDFGSLPCPPSGVEVPAGQPYRPLLAPPPFITAIPGWNSNFDDCNPGTGIDPPTAMTSANGGIPGPVAPGGPLPRRNDDRAYPHPHLVPRAPLQTTAPS